MVGRLQGKVAVVTGASRGIGKGIARILAREGARMLVVARGEAQGTSTVEEIRQAGGEASWFAADVRADEEDHIQRHGLTPTSASG